MDITDPIWADADQTGVIAVVDGHVSFIPADPSNRHFAAIEEQVMAIADHDPHVIAALWQQN